MKLQINAKRSFNGKLPHTFHYSVSPRNDVGLVFVTVYGLLELYVGVTGSGQDIAHFALGGMMAGYLLLTYWGRQSESAETPAASGL